MADQSADAKATINQDGLGASSASDGPLHSRDSENFIQTVDLDEVAGGKGPDKGKDEGTDKGADGDDDRFDKHPRFQELNQRMKDAEERAEALQAEIEGLKGKGEGKAEGDAADWKPLFTYEDITKMGDEVIRERMEDKPTEFLTNFFCQAVDETAKVIMSMLDQRTKQSTAKSDFETFAGKHPGDPESGVKGFNELYKSGAITKYMKENPGHNFKSAYLEMTQEAREKAVMSKAGKAAEADAAKKAEEARRNKEAKAGAKVLGAGPGGAPAGDRNADLKDTKARGGLANVLAQRLAERRRAQS